MESTSNIYYDAFNRKWNKRPFFIWAREGKNKACVSEVQSTVQTQRIHFPN